MKPEETIAILNEAYFSDAPHEQQVLKDLQPILVGMKSFCDVGASLGQFTKFANECLFSADITSIEADPLRHRELEANIARWSENKRNRFRTLHGAATRSPGTVTFQVTNSNVSGSIFPSDLPHLDPTIRASVQWQKVTVPSIVLDELYPDSAPDFIKMDIEGGELGALQGARRLLARRKTILLIEFHNFVMVDGQPVGPQSQLLLKSLGYSEIIFHGKSLFYTGSAERFRSHWIRHKTLAPLKTIARIIKPKSF